MNIAAHTILLAVTILGGSAHAAHGVGQTVWIKLPSEGGAAIELEATLYKPEAVGKAPVVVFHHGSSGGPIPAGYTEKAQGLASFLNQRGIGLLVPMRSGRGQSGGPNHEEPSACTVASTTSGLAHASKAVDAAVAYLGTQPWADLDRLAMAGHSRGGLLATTYAARHPGQLRAVINFSGGWKDDKCAAQDINLTLFAAAGTASATPALFLYARGDGFYTDASMEGYARVYNDAGGRASFKFYQLAGVNGHLLFRRAQSLWEADVDAFLRSAGMIDLPSTPLP